MNHTYILEADITGLGNYIHLRKATVTVE